jgi:hypothetical protein
VRSLFLSPPSLSSPVLSSSRPFQLPPRRWTAQPSGARRPRDGGAGGYCRSVARGRHGRPRAPAGCESEGSPPRRRRARAEGGGHGQVWYAPLEAKSVAVATFLDVSFASFHRLSFMSLDLHYVMPDRHNLKQLELHLDRPIRGSDSAGIRNIMAASYGY